MRYFIIAGERSGDLHASNLIKALKKEDSNADILCWGGDYMEQAGARLAKHYKDISFMGFAEVLSNATKIFRAFKDCKADISKYNPDVVILIDFAGFNLRIAKFAKENGLKVFYYISPKVWAWNQSRAYKIKELVDRMFVIMPFEKDFYKKFNYEVDYVGNPLNDAIAAYIPNPQFKKQNNFDDKAIIAVLPGSRKQEVETMLQLMVSILDFFPDHRFVVAAVSNLPKSYYENFRKDGRVDIVYDQTYDVLSNATAALVTSGTATLETALFEIPQVVCYKASALTYIIAKSLIKVKYISLVNLIADKELVKELIQKDLNTLYIKKELEKIIFDKDNRNLMLKGYKDLKILLGEKGASVKTAKLMVEHLTKRIEKRRP
jgi:lipid-A-disaccharide synthase